MKLDIIILIFKLTQNHNVEKKFSLHREQNK